MSSALLASLLLATVVLGAGRCIHPPQGVAGVAQVFYTVWDGTQQTIQVLGELVLGLPEGSTFYTAMLHAAKVNKHFSFKADLMQGQHYITSIGGKSYDPKKGFYWMIYKLSKQPDTHNLPDDTELTPRGVDRTYVSNGDHYLFWLKKVSWAQMNNATS